MKLFKLLLFCFFLSTFFVGYSQTSNITADLHDMNVDNNLDIKRISFNVLNCSQADFDKIVLELKKSTIFSVFKSVYSKEYTKGLLMLSKTSIITTSDIADLLTGLGITQANFNNKKIELSSLSTFKFTPVERNAHINNFEN
jgi:hypothetical protein